MDAHYVGIYVHFSFTKLTNQMTNPRSFTEMTRKESEGKGYA
jgi:hypothetical protein